MLRWLTESPGRVKTRWQEGESDREAAWRRLETAMRGDWDGLGGGRTRDDNGIRTTYEWRGKTSKQGLA